MTVGVSLIVFRISDKSVLLRLTDEIIGGPCNVFCIGTLRDRGTTADQCYPCQSTNSDRVRWTLPLPACRLRSS